jgi:hypothetical protein
MELYLKQTQQHADYGDGVDGVRKPFKRGES